MDAMVDSSSLRSGSGRETVVKSRRHGVPTLRAQARAGCCKGPSDLEICASACSLQRRIGPAIRPSRKRKSPAARTSNRERRRRQPHPLNENASIQHIMADITNPTPGTLDWRLSAHPITLVTFLGFRACEQMETYLPVIHL